MTLYQKIYNWFWNYIDPVEVDDIDHNPKTAFELLKLIRSKYSLPQRQGMKGVVPSNTEITNWLKQGAVVINGVTPQPNDPIEFPITELVFFPKGNRVTLR